MDMNSGDVVHVDFNCLFEKVKPSICCVDESDQCMQGKTLDTPERVPFRLTQNIVDGLGISGVEGGRALDTLSRVAHNILLGAFRIACEVTLQLLRDNKDSLMSVLDAFVHDPLVEWEDEKRKMVSILSSGSPSP